MKEIVKKVTIIPPVPDDKCPGYHRDIPFEHSAGMINVSTCQLDKYNNCKKRSIGNLDYIEFTNYFNK